ncbi:MAG: NAD(P)-dependent glycerol-3-phosphate dehydrogenase [Salinarimonadaceae bacterium]|nr:MAG: NAD(P)-dependent glycerol-3-phosphate dehydrogenase [Salinarimonadaceae bacterium]
MSDNDASSGALVGVVGAGAWGTALANAAASSGARVVLWGRDPDAIERIRRTRENARYLPGVGLHENVTVTADLAALAEVEAALLVTPSQTARQMARALSPILPQAAPLVLCAKGIERETGCFLSDVVAEARPGAAIAVLSGPSFAADVARGLPTAVTLACRDGGLAARLATLLSGPALRIYHGDDVRGAEIGGAAKNVLAIACGGAIGRGLGESARAALIARGFAEMMRFARAYGGRPETLMGLSGLGDVVLTCSSAQSRNFAFGERLGRGASPQDAAAGKLAEGAFTASVLVALARARDVEVPIAQAVDDLVAGRVTPDEALDRLMNRPLRSEI